MITPSFGLTATERVLPKLALDFTTASLDSRVAFTRSGNTATVVNSSGYVAGINADLPRFDYDPITLLCKGLLIEETRENRFIYSGDFSQATWSKTQSAVTVDAVNAPTGTLVADKLTTNTTSAEHSVLSPNNTIVSGTTYTVSLFAKAGEESFAFMGWNSAGFGSAAPSFFNLSTGVATAGTGQTVSMVDFGDGWWRCTTTRTATATTSTNTGIRIGLTKSNTSSTSTGANTTDGIYIWGAQLEAGAFATSYIPTTSTFVTRNADVATMTGTNFSDFWQATRGGVLVRARPGTVSGTRPWLQFDDGTADNIIALRGNTTNPELYIKATTDQAQIDAGAIAANTSYRLAGIWGTDSCAASINSATPVLDGAATIPTVTQARLGSDGTNYLNGWLESIEYYDTRPTNADLQVLSSAAGYRSMIRSMINPIL